MVLLWHGVGGVDPRAAPNGCRCAHRPSLTTAVCGGCVFQDYIAFNNKAAVVLPHTAGRYQMKRFRKATVRRQIQGAALHCVLVPVLVQPSNSRPATGAIV